ncbi:MAG: hypothetical protein IIC90_13150 [Chloroflexi bacterium]|nr:hypothetical protein [Chloroflexota bacterium]
MCRQGASAIQTSVLDEIDDPALRAYVAWVPILPDDNEPAARESCGLIPDARATHFWDEQRVLPDTFASVLGLPEGWPAWDVYLAYPPGVTWPDSIQKAPPAPAFWHHQLGDLELAPKLDAPAFAVGVKAILDE